MAKSLVSCFFDSRCSIVSLLYRNTGKYKTVNCKIRLATKLQPCWNYGDTFSLWPIGAQIGLGLHFNNSTAANQSEFFCPRDAMPARVLAMARCLSVCVCHKSVCYPNVRANRAGVWHYGLLRPVVHGVLKNFRWESWKLRVLPSATLF